MRKYAIALIVLAVVSALYFLFFSQSGFNPPEEYRLNVTHVSDIEESRKYGEAGVGGHCYLASTTMMLKSFDSSIEFWQVLVARGNATGFSYYFPKGNESEIKEGLGGKGTAMALKAIKNMGFKPHIRLRAMPLFGRNNEWVKMAIELGGDAKTYWFMPPMGEYKSVIASGTPLVAAGSPCWQDFNVIEGYEKGRLFVVVPNPGDQGKTDPKISCSSLGAGLQNEVFWATPEGKQIRHSEILADMKTYAQQAPENMLMYANYLQKGSSIVNFEIERLYLARLLAAKYLEERGYKDLAAGYKKSASLFYELTKFVPPDIDENKYKDEIANTIREIADNEKSLISKWTD